MMRARLVGVVSLVASTLFMPLGAQAVTSPWRLLAHEPSFMSGSTGLSVAPGTPGSTTFVLPASAPDGPSTLRVVVHGIVSTPWTVAVTGGPPPRSASSP
ncbi:MAG: hypothetical protein B7Z69_07950 [Actinobacteria bacterium 21-73-9]|nr:MAG: hypothetical protein B7Z69_07950 [Actinobacteria bacterium 21-73-9]